uniref:Ubiquitin-like domain-containing protein n=1 Tax=Plectus sambesii TaxID=2011161 RepID=A0A914WK08_9BILA
MDVHPSETIRAVKRLLHAQLEGVVPSASRQRWFFGGRLLTDKVTIADCNIPPHFVVQVVVKETIQQAETEIPHANRPNEQEQQTSGNDCVATNERRSSTDSIHTTKPRKKRRSHSEPVQR